MAEGLGGMLPPIVVELVAKASEFKASLKEASAETEEFETKTEATMAKVSAVGKASLLMLGGGALAVGGFALDMADKFEKSHARLEAALKANGTSFDAQKASVDKADASMEDLGFTNAQTEDALATLTTALGDPKKAYADMALAADLARAKNIDLNSAALLVAKAAEGQTRPLKALGIDLPVAAGGAQKLKQAQDGLAKAEAELAVARAKSGLTLAQQQSLQASAAQSALRLEQAQARVQSAQNAVNQVLAKYPDAANAASKGHQALLQAQEKLKLATDAAKVAAMSQGKTMSNTAGAAAYEKALANVHDAQQKVNDAQGAGTTILDALQSKLKGQAQAAAETFAGKVQHLKTQAEDLGAKLGMVLIPMIEKVIDVTMSIVTWLEKHKTIAMALGIIIGTVLVAAIGVYIAGLVTAAAESVAAAAEMILPWLPLIIIIGAIAIAGYELVKHWKVIWKTITDVVTAVWHWIDDKIIHPIVAAFKWVVDEIERHWRLIVSILLGPLGIAIALITKYWNDIVAAVEWVIDMVKQHWQLILEILTGPIGIAVALIRHFWDDIVGAVEWLIDEVKQHWQLILEILTGPIGIAVAIIRHFWDDIVNTFEGVISTIENAGKTMWDFVWNGLKTVIGWVTGGFDGVIGFLSGLPGRISSAVSGMWDSIWDGFKAVLNFIIGGWDSLHFTLPKVSLGPLGSFGGEDIGVPQIPKLMGGGDLLQGGWATVGEFGRENVFLPKGAQVQPLPRNSGGGGGGGGTIVIEVPVQLDSREIARVVTPPVRDSLIRKSRGMPNIFGGTA